MTDTTLPVGLVDPDQETVSTQAFARSPAPGAAMVLTHDRGPVLWQFIRAGRSRLEVCGYTTAGDLARHRNQDGAILMPLPGGGLLVAVCDGVTHSTGIDSGALRDRVLEDLRNAADGVVAEPARLVHQLHIKATDWLDRVASGAHTGLAITLIVLEPGGRYSWATLGDVGLYQHAPRAAWLRGLGGPTLRRLNLVGRETGENRLIASIAQRKPLCVETGAGRLDAGHVLLLGSDGALSMPNHELAATLDAYQRNRALFTARDLLLRIDALALQHETFADDRTLVIVQALREAANAS